MVDDDDDMPAERPTARLAVTFGDAAGVGPEVVATTLLEHPLADPARIVLLATEAEARSAAADAGAGPEDVRRLLAMVAPDGLTTPDVPRAVPSAAAGRAALERLRRAVVLAQAGAVAGVLFGPLHKANLHLAGMHEPDELRWFETQMQVHTTTSEINVLDDLWTARVTSHVAMRAVPDLITVDQIRGVAQLLVRTLQAAGTAHPRLAVCAYNPHAGEQGAFGREEIDVIEPAVASLRQDGLQVIGPRPADTIFLAARRGEVDGVVTMYHDQGQIALKMVGFDRGVTLQGGLPVPVSTPAHGTAFDIVGTRSASATATHAALDVVAALAGVR